MRRTVTTRGPTWTRTRFARVRAISQAAAMRVPLPDISASVPSGFTIATCMSSPSTSSTCTTPSSSGSIVNSSLSATRYTFPCACQLDDVIRDLARRAIAGDDNDARDPPHPLPLVGGVAPGADDDRAFRLVGRERRDLVQPEGLARRRRNRSCQRRTDLVLHAPLEHLARPPDDSLLELVLRHVEAHDDRRVPEARGPELRVVRAQRPPQLRELERADHALPVVRVDRSRTRVALEQGPHRLRAVLVVEPRPALPSARGRRRRQLELAERRPEVQAGAADHDRCLPGRERPVDRLLCERCVLADGGLVLERPDRDEGRSRLVR